MKKYIKFFGCLGMLCAAGCTGKFNPFADDNHFDTAFGYPPKALAEFLYIDNQLTVDLSELNKEKPRY